MFEYRIAGLGVSSDLEAPGFAPVSLRAAPDIVIRRSAVAPCLDDALADGPTWAMRPGRFLLDVPRIVRFLLSDGRLIEYEAAPGAERDDVAAFTVSVALGILLQQRGLATLHASAVSVAGRAVLFLGASGAGKSTLASALAQRGYPLVADDFCVLRLAPDGPRVQPDGGLCRLWAETIDELGLERWRGPPVRGRLSKFYVAPALSAAGGEASLPLGPAYVLRETRAPLRPGIERPNIVDAALILRAAAFRPGVVAKLGQASLYFAVAAAMGNGAGLFELTRAMSFEALDGVIAQLEAHWAEAGLMPAAAVQPSRALA